MPPFDPQSKTAIENYLFGFHTYILKRFLIWQHMLVTDATDVTDVTKKTFQTFSKPLLYATFRRGISWCPPFLLNTPASYRTEANYPHHLPGFDLFSFRYAREVARSRD